MTPGTIGGLLRERRERLGASLAEAAAWSDVPAASLRAWEEGGGVLGSTEYERVCRGLGVSAGELYRSGEADPRGDLERLGAATRTHALAPGDLRLLAMAMQVGRVLGGLIDFLGREAPLRPHRRWISVDPVRPVEQGRALGALARRDLWGDRPTSDLPALLDDLLVHVVDVDITGELHSVSLWDPSGVPLVLVNRRSLGSAHERSELFAHQLCHLLHDGSEDGRVTSVCGRVRDASEERAAAFGVAFRSPAEASRGDLVWTRRPQPSEVAESRRDEWDLPASRRDLPAPASPLLSGLAEELVLRALAHGHISQGRARELLSWS